MARNSDTQRDTELHGIDEVRARDNEENGKRAISEASRPKGLVVACETVSEG
jgi:hypothetical protein